MCRHHGAATFRDRWRPPVKPCGKFVPIGQARGGICGTALRVSAAGYPGREAGRLGMGPAVVLGQDLAEVPGPVGDGAVADLAARDRKLGNGHREAAGT